MANHDVTLLLEYGGAVHDHTSELLASYPVAISSGAQDWSAEVPPTTARFAFKGWRMAPGNASSDLYGLVVEGTPVQITVATNGGTAGTQFTGEIVSRSVRQVSQRDSDELRMVEVEASDVTHRLARGEPLADSVSRFMARDGSTNLAAYWSMGTAEGVRRLPAAGGTTRPLRVTDAFATLATAELAPHLGAGTSIDGALTIASGAQLRAQLPTSATRLVIDHAFRYPSGALDFISGHGWVIDRFAKGSDDGFAMLFDVVQNGATAEDQAWQFALDVGTDLDVEAFVADERADIPEAIDGQMHHTRLDLSVNPGTGLLTYAVYLDGVEVIGGTDSSTLTSLRGNRFLLQAYTTQPGAVILGHVAVWEGTPPDLADTVAAYRGHVGEHAGRRIERLCAEEAIGLATFGDRDDTVPLGPQHPVPVLALLREAATTDGGVLTGRQDNPGVFARLGRSLYNRDPTMQLDYAQGHVGHPWEVVAGWQHLTNDVTATDRSGATATAVRTTGPGNVSEPTVDPEGRGRWRGPARAVNPMSAAMLPNQAGWMLLHGTQLGQRLIRLTVDLDAKPELADQVRLTPLGGRITVDNLPPTLTPDLADVIAAGWTETISEGGKRRKITYLAAPNGPYRVADPPEGIARVGFSALWLRTGTVTKTQTSITFRNEEGPDVVHESDFDVVLGGERMTVTGIGSWSGTYPERTASFTVVRSVNGVVKGHTAPSRVTMAEPVHIGL
jgi:hypothetical protein